MNCLVGEAELVSSLARIDLDTSGIIVLSLVGGPSILLSVGSRSCTEIIDLVLAVVLGQVEEARDLDFSIVLSARIVGVVVVVIALKNIVVQIAAGLLGEAGCGV